MEDLRRVNTAENFIKLLKEGSYEGFISHLTIEELLKAPDDIRERLMDIISGSGVVVLEETDESIDLANAYVNDKVSLSDIMMMPDILQLVCVMR